MFEDLYRGMGSRIKGRRTDLKWTQAQLAEKANLDPSHISRLENGAHGKLETYLKITEALQISFDELIQDASLTARENLYTQRLLECFHKLPSIQHKSYVIKIVEEFVEFTESQ